jgi:hypothetical protein
MPRKRTTVTVSEFDDSAKPRRRRRRRSDPTTLILVGVLIAILLYAVSNSHRDGFRPARIEQSGR